MTAKYSRLSTSDSMEDVKIDFGSPFTYSDTDNYCRPASGNYKSAFTYKDWSPHLERADARYVRGMYSRYHCCCIDNNTSITIWLCVNMLYHLQCRMGSSGHHCSKNINMSWCSQLNQCYSSPNLSFAHWICFYIM